MKKILVGLLVTVVLSGCATDARKRIDEINASFKEDGPRLEKCDADFEKRENTIYVRKYVLLDMNKKDEGNLESKLPLYTSDKKLTPEMKKHFSTYMSDDVPCADIWSNLLQKISPEIVQNNADYRSAKRALFLEALAGTITIGELNRQYDKLVSHYKKNHLARMKELVSQLLAEEQREKNLFLGSVAAGIAGASHAHSERMAQERKEDREAYNRIFKPAVTTNCRADGIGGVTCVSQ